MELKEIPINKIKPNPMQPREQFDKQKIKELAESVKEVGLINPIQVRPKGEQFEIISGERRWRASDVAKKKTIPAIVKEIDNGQVAIESLIENVHRENLSDVEKAKSLKLIAEKENFIKKDGSINQTQLSNKVSLSQAEVSDIFDSADMKAELSGPDRTVSKSVITETRGLPKEERKQIIKKAVKEELGGRKVRKIVSAIRKSSEPIKQSLIEGNIEPEEAEEIMDMPEEDQRKALRMKQQGSLSMKEIRKTIEGTKKHPMHRGKTKTGDDILLDIQGQCLLINDNTKSFFALKSIEDVKIAEKTMDIAERTIDNLLKLKEFINGVI